MRSWTKRMQDVLSYAQAEKRCGWAPCQVRYGRWPNGARVKHV